MQCTLEQAPPVWQSDRLGRPRSIHQSAADALLPTEKSLSVRFLWGEKVLGNLQLSLGLIKKGELERKNIVVESQIIITQLNN